MGFSIGGNGKRKTTMTADEIAKAIVGRNYFPDDFVGDLQHLAQAYIALRDENEKLRKVVEAAKVLESMDRERK